ncbi:MAG: hypothetical protein R6U93_07360 [Dehalococcoidia bacterium]
MDAHSFIAKLNSPVMYPTVYERSYNDFWEWKIEVEAGGTCHILDDRHRDDACKRLLKVLPSWKTYRRVKCDYKTWLPISLSNIVDAYDQIRKYDLLSFDRIPIAPLKLIWHELGRVKTVSYQRTQDGKYFVIAVCKPLMFIWGQTPPFDSRNRANIIKDRLYRLPNGGRWSFDWWRLILDDLRQALLLNPSIINDCEGRANQIWKSSHIIPYGRLLDIYYF